MYGIRGLQGIGAVGGIGDSEIGRAKGNENFAG